MASVLDHYNPYSTDSKLEWDGMRSSKFGKTKVFFPQRDSIHLGLEMPSQSVSRGRKHYEEPRSPERQFRSIVKIIPKMNHWHPRESRKKVFNMSFTESFPRRQKSHRIPQFPSTARQAGIRTFYNTRVREDNFRQYSLEDRMQRKSRVDQYQLRRTFFLKDKGDKQKSFL